MMNMASDQSTNRGGGVAYATLFTALFSSTPVAMTFTSHGVIAGAVALVVAAGLFCYIVHRHNG